MTPVTTRGDRSSTYALWLVIGVALVIRVAYLLQYQHSAFWDQLTVDNWYHHNWSNSLAEGNLFGDTTYFRAPFYIYCLGLLYGLFGSSLWTARLFGMAIGLASVAMTYGLGRKLVDRRTGIIAASLHAVYPLTVYFEGEILLDSLFLLLVQITVYCFLRWRDTSRASDLLWTGLACGLAAITRPTVLVAVPLVIIWVLAVPGLKDRTKHVMMFLVGLAVFVTPVFARNVIVADDPVPIASQGGINLYIGNNDSADGYSAAMPEPLGYNWEIAQITWLAEKNSGRDLKPGEVSDYWRNRALTWISDHPGRFLELYLKKIYLQFANLEVSNNRPFRAVFEDIPLLRYNPLSFGLVFPLAVLGIIATRGRHRGMAFVLLLACLYLATVSLFFYSSRFRLPLLPIYFILAAAGVGMLKDQISARLGRRLVGSLALAVAAGIVSFSTALTFPYVPAPQSELSSGLAAYRSHDFDTALDRFRTARQINPEFPEVNLNIGACYFRKGQADSAHFYFERERVLHPGRVKTYHNLASFELVNGDYRRAQAWSRTALDIAPYDVTANILLVRALGADSAVSSASLVDETVLAAGRSDSNLFLLNEAAAVLSRRGDMISAAKFSNDALEAEPPPIEIDPRAFGPDFRNARGPFAREKAKTWHLLGYIAGIEDRLEEAIRCSQQAVANDPDFEEAYLNLVIALGTAGRATEADSLLSIALEKFPDNSPLRQLEQLRIP